MGSLVMRRPAIRLACATRARPGQIGLVLVRPPRPGFVLAKCRIRQAGRPATLRFRPVPPEALAPPLFAILPVRRLLGDLLRGLLVGLPGWLLGWLLARGHADRVAAQSLRCPADEIGRAAR